jgi:DNA-binding IclR family transcriptional regulator
LNLDAELSEFISSFPERKRAEAHRQFVDAVNSVVESYIDEVPAATALEWLQDDAATYVAQFEGNRATALLDKFVRARIYAMTLN